MSQLSLSVAIGDYDRNRALMDGTVLIDGVDPVFMRLTPEEIFFRAFRNQDFDICELSLSSFTVKTAAGTCPYVGVPVFVSRCFRHTSIYVRTDRIKKPQDLKGKKVGLPEYQLTANVWARAFLEDDYGVKPSDIHWIRGGIDDVGRPEKISIKLPPGVRLDDAPEGKTISQLLIDGEIDAFMAPRTPSKAALKHPHIGWLFPDTVAVAKDYYKRTGIFPIMHLIGVRRTLAEKYPYLPSAVLKAFERSKAMALEELADSSTAKATLPFLEEALVAARASMGEDFWPYGVEPNRKTLDAFLHHHHAQGLSPRRVAVEELFHPATLETFKSDPFVLIVDNVTIRIAGRVILDGASAAISDGRKVGLIGRNGAGKSTLLNLILGKLESETGGIEYSKLWRIGAVAQEAPAGPISLIDTVLAADTERTRLLEEETHEAAPEKLGEIHARLEAIDAYSAPARGARILAGLGFPAEDQARPCSEFSGGWRMRVALAAVLFTQPDLLLLDEPTNYLDLEGALWLEDYLKRYRGTVLLVSHDRDLLNRAVDSILHLEHGKLTLYSGGYDTFVDTRAQKLALDAAAKAHQDAERKRIQAFIDRFRAKATKASQAQSRMKWLEKMKPITITVADRMAPIQLPQPEAIAPPVIALDRVSIGYTAGKPVLSNVTLRIDSDDRIALLGQNGNGKSTLAKLLSGRLEAMSGEVKRARKLVTGYFAQHQLDELDGEKSALQTLWVYRPRFDETTARTRLGGFGFSGDKADTKIANLSGGERARLLIAIATLEKPNLLILDEPTNHLDIDAREQLLEALNEYEGAVVLISHDRRLIDGCADRLMLVADGRVTPYDGDLEEYKRLVLSARGAGNDTGAREAKSASKADLRREAADKRQQLKPLKDAMDRAEREVSSLHGEIERLDAALATPGLFVKDPSKGQALSKKRGETLKQLQAAETRWIEAAEQYEAAN